MFLSLLPLTAVVYSSEEKLKNDLEGLVRIAERYSLFENKESSSKEYVPISFTQTLISSNININSCLDKIHNSISNIEKTFNQQLENAEFSDIVFYRNVVFSYLMRARDVCNSLREFLKAHPESKSHESHPKIESIEESVAAYLSKFPNLEEALTKGYIESYQYFNKIKKPQDKPFYEEVFSCFEKLKLTDNEKNILIRLPNPLKSVLRTAFEMVKRISQDINSMLVTFSESENLREYLEFLEDIKNLQNLFLAYGDGGSEIKRFIRKSQIVVDQVNRFFKEDADPDLSRRVDEELLLYWIKTGNLDEYDLFRVLIAINPNPGFLKSELETELFNFYVRKSSEVIVDYCVQVPKSLNFPCFPEQHKLDDILNRVRSIKAIVGDSSKLINEYRKISVFWKPLLFCHPFEEINRYSWFFAEILKV
jgi:hypothetical protein